MYLCISYQVLWGDSINPEHGKDFMEEVICGIIQARGRRGYSSGRSLMKIVKKKFYLEIIANYIKSFVKFNY